MQLPKTQFTNKQIAFIAIAGIVGLVVLLILFGVLPGRRVNPEMRTLQVWGVDSSRVWANTISQFQSVYKDVSVKYRSINEDSYEETLINALAAGGGPDVLMFDNNWLTKHGDKIIPVPSEKMSINTLQSLFPQVIESELTGSGRIFALPLSIDTLVLAYNRDLFDQGGVVFPPLTWAELIDQIEDLKREDGNGNLERGAFALGGSSVTVPNSTEILRALLIQKDILLVDARRGRASFDTRDGRAIFEDYLSFTDPNSPRYSWDNSFRNASDAFARGEVAGIFVFADELNNLTARNAFLDIEVSPFPQLEANSAINTADYWGLAVSSSAKDINLAWDFIIFAATSQEAAEDYLLMTQKPPALRILIDKYAASPSLGVFVSQGLTARGQNVQPSDEALRNAFDNAIEAVFKGEIVAKQAVSRAASTVSNLLK